MFKFLCNFLLIITIVIILFFTLALTVLQSKFVLSYLQSQDVRYFYNTTNSDSSKDIVLTIDDGPDIRTTPAILAVLRKHQVSATFFVIGEKVAKDVMLTREIKNEGHCLGNHDFKDFASILRPGTFAESFETTDDLIKSIYGQTFDQEFDHRSLYFRPGCGFYNNAMIDVIKDKGYKLILGNIYPHDVLFSRLFSINAIINYIYYRISPGSIIILHDSRPELQTDQVLDRLIPMLKARGYQFKSLSEIERKYN